VPRTAKAYKLAGPSVPVAPQFGQLGNSSFALVGNPFMATIDFGALYTANTSLIKNNYQIWTKVDATEGYIGYNADGTWGIVQIGIAPDALIAPLQGFIVERNGTATGSLTFNIATVTATTGTGILRTIAATNDKLDIVATNATASVRTFIAQREGGSDRFASRDSRKLMNGFTEAPEIYTLKPSDEGQIATGANINNGGDLLIPLGLATTATGDISLAFTGMDTYAASIVFTDKAAGKEIDLTGRTSYTYTFAYTPPQKDGQATATDDRFTLRLTSKPTATEAAATGYIHLHSYAGAIYASASRTIEEISVYTLQGILVYHARPHAAAHVSTRLAPGVYIVKIDSEIKKIVIQ
jgi:hypothetical protein